MKSRFYQVGKIGPWTVDHPDGRSINHRPGEVFEAKPANRSVVRGLRQKRLREMTDREVRALQAAKDAKIKADAEAAAKKAKDTAPAPKPVAVPLPKPKPESGE